MENFGFELFIMTFRDDVSRRGSIIHAEIKCKFNASRLTNRSEISYTKMMTYFHHQFERKKTSSERKRQTNRNLRNLTDSNFSRIYPINQYRWRVDVNPQYEEKRRKILVPSGDTDVYTVTFNRLTIQCM